MHTAHVLAATALAVCCAWGTAELAAAQTFQRTYGGANFEEGRDVLALPDGGFVVTGNTTSTGPGTESLWVMRTNALGEPLWSHAFGGQFNEVGQRVRQHPDGGFVVLGHTDNSWGNQRSLYLLRLSAEGDLLWSRTVGSAGNDDATDLLLLPDGGYLLTGNSGAFGSRRLLVARLDANGDLLWVQQPGGAGFDGGFSLAPASDGGFIAVGTTEGLGPGQRDFLVIRYTAAGTLQWVRTYGGSGNEQAFSVVPAGADGWQIAGSTTTFGSGGQSMLLLRIDDQGTPQWAKAYGGPRLDVLRRMIPAHAGGYVIAGTLLGTPGQSVDHGLLMHLADDGAVLWAHTYGLPGQQSDLRSVDRTADGYVATGYRFEAATVSDLLLLRTDLEGQSGCDQALLDMPVADVPLTVTTPSPLNSTTGIFTTVPPTANATGPATLATACLELGTGLAPQHRPLTLRAYPNPAHEQLWVDAPAGPGALRIVDARGTVVMQRGLQRQPLDIGPLPPGMYHGVWEGAGDARTFRFVKE